jgi:uncharacterized protein (DUF39 family)
MWILAIKEILDVAGKLGVSGTFQKVDVVTTCIFGAMIGWVPQFLISSDPNQNGEDVI